MKNIENLSTDVLETRTSVWEVLSEFWLDTELQDFRLHYIKKVLAASPYSLAEVKAIHRYEVAPAVSANLMSVAGEWAGFDTTWLTKQCHANALRRQKLLHRARLWLQGPMLWFFTRRYWRHVIPHMLALRSAVAQQGIRPDGPASGGSAG